MSGGAVASEFGVASQAMASFAFDLARGLPAHTLTRGHGMNRFAKAEMRPEDKGRAIPRSLIVGTLLSLLCSLAAAMDAGLHTAAPANLYLLAEDNAEPPRFVRDRLVLFRCETQGLGAAAMDEVSPRPECAERLSDGEAIAFSAIRPLQLEPARTAGSPWHAAYRVTLASGETRILWHRAFDPDDRSGLAIETRDFGSPFFLQGFALLTDGKERDRCCHRSFTALEGGKRLWSLGYVYEDAAGALWQDASMHVETFPGADIAYLEFAMPGPDPRREAFVEIAAFDGRPLEPDSHVHVVDARRLHAAVQAAGEQLLPASRLGPVHTNIVPA
jgi:hypothetical protein